VLNFNVGPVFLSRVVGALQIII